MSPLHGRTYYFPSKQALDIGQLCRLAASELIPGGIISIRDWLVPGSRLRGKKAQQQREAGNYINTILSMAGEGYGRGHSLAHYQDILRHHGFSMEHYLIKSKRIHFYDWLAESDLSHKDSLRLKALILQAPAPACEYLTPYIAGDRIIFCLQEILLIGRAATIH